jgi:uncharacterized Tic20 family protein
MSEETTLTATSDERMMAALAHFFGAIGALIIWVVQKEKSRFVRFQAVQALAFDLSVMFLMLVLFACLFGAMFIGMFGSIFATLNTSTSPENVGPFLFIPLMFIPLMTICIFPFSLGILVARIVATLSVLNGNNFRYPLLGSQVEKFLADEKRS